MTTVFARETLTEHLIAEMLPLLSAHWREVAQFQDIPLDVDIATYLNAESSGLARCYTVREPFVFDTFPPSSNALVGYAVFFVRPNPHYRASVQAVQDVLYLDPSMRGGKGGEFIGWCDEQLRAEGVQISYHHAKLAHPQLGKALARLGYEPVETIWARRLDVGSLTVAPPQPGHHLWVDTASGDTMYKYGAPPFSPTDGTVITAPICDEDGG